MSQFTKTGLPKLLMLVFGVFLLVDFFVNVPKEYHATATLIQNFTQIIAAFSIGLGVASILTYHGRLTLKRATKNWYYSVWLLVMFLIFAVVGFGYGPNSPQYGWLFNNIFVPVNQTMYSLLGVFIVYALYRTFQAKNIYVAIMLVIGLFTLMGRAPMAEIIWSGFPWIMNNWLQTLNIGGYRAFIIATAIGAVALGIRTLLGRSRALFGG
jgi:hypothetical protein